MLAWFITNGFFFSHFLILLLFMDFSEKLSVYKSRSIDKGMGWLLFLFFGWSYGLTNQMGKQILFYLTAGGLGFWSLYRLFTWSSAMDRFNQEVADSIGFTQEEKKKIGL
jgi:hypothetical protein